MLFSRLFVILILLGIIPISIAALFGGAFYMFVIYNALLAALFLIDLVITPRPRFVTAERICEEKLSLGVENEIGFRVRNSSNYALQLMLRDDIPPYFAVRNQPVRIRVGPHEEAAGSFWVTPKKRGEFVFGRVACRYSGILRLCTKSTVFLLERSYKVYPNLKDLRKYSLAAIKKSNLLQGSRRSRDFNLGTEFESLREYNTGDDYRKINWQATARRSKLIVNNYEPEKNQQIFVLLDSSRVMNSEIEYVKKLDYAINSAFVLADFVTRKGDNAGLLVFDSEVRRFVKPGKGTGHFQLIAENLYNVEENLVTADYENALTYLTGQQKRRSLLCIFTELFNKEEALRLAAVLKSIARNHVPLVVTIRDPRIHQLANATIRQTRDVFVKGAASRLEEERDKVQRVLRDSGIACMDIEPDSLSVEVINKYLNMKASLQV
jgi:uncharacterized protein (DUF58 family)